MKDSSFFIPEVYSGNKLFSFFIIIEGFCAFGADGMGQLQVRVFIKIFLNSKPFAVYPYFLTGGANRKHPFEKLYHDFYIIYCIQVKNKIIYVYI